MLRRVSITITKAQEADLLRVVHSPDASPEAKHEARSQIIRANIRFAYSVVLRYARTGTPNFDDLFSAACDGLYKAINAFKPDRIGEIKFISYAVWWIRQRINVTLVEQRSEGFSGCAGAYDRSAKLKADIKAFEDEGVEAPDHLVRRQLALNTALSGGHTRLDAPVAMDDGHAPREMADPSAYTSILNDVDAASTNQKILRDLLEGEDPLLVRVFELRFGLNSGGDTATFDEISRTLLASGYKGRALSRERVRQIVTEGLRRLQKRATLLGYNRYSFQAEETA